MAGIALGDRLQGAVALARPRRRSVPSARSTAPTAAGRRPRPGSASRVPSVSVPVLSTQIVSTAASASVAAICWTSVFWRASRTAATARVTLISSTRPSGIRVTRPGGRLLGGVAERRVVEAEADQDDERDRDQRDRGRPEDRVDLDLKRRRRMAELACLAGDLLRVALLTDRVELVVAGAREHERAREQPVAGALADPVGLAGEQRLVDGQPAGVDDGAVGDELVARLDPDEVAGNHLVGVSSISRPSRITFARGATSSASRSRVSFAFSSWRIRSPS